LSRGFAFGFWDTEGKRCGLCALHRGKRGLAVVVSILPTARYPNAVREYTQKGEGLRYFDYVKGVTKPMV
jgi:hypothetical protein